MKRLTFLLMAVAMVAGVVASIASTSGAADGEAAPISGVKIPPGYRDWRLISVAHEEGQLNDIRAILGNDIASGRSGGATNSDSIAVNPAIPNLSDS